MFDNHSKEEEIYPLMVLEIADQQRTDPALSKFFERGVPSKESQYQFQVAESTKILRDEESRMVIPKSLQGRMIAWYHHYLQHSRHT